MNLMSSFKHCNIFYEIYSAGEKLVPAVRELNELSATVAEYETKLLPKELLRSKINEWYEVVEEVIPFSGIDKIVVRSQ